jgi:hypothetical protein
MAFAGWFSKDVLSKQYFEMASKQKTPRCSEGFEI